MATLGPLNFHMYFRMFFNFCKESSWDFVKGYFEFVDNLGERIAALAILTLPIHKHIIRLPLFRSFISFNIFFFLFGVNILDFC